jgi:hypothetical protein
MVAADDRTAITFALSPGNAHDAPEGRELLRDLGSFPGMPVIMDRAYEGNETRQLVLALDMVPVVPPKSNRVDPWRYDRALYKKRNEIERSSPLGSSVVRGTECGGGLLLLRHVTPFTRRDVVYFLSGAHIPYWLSVEVEYFHLT